MNPLYAFIYLLWEEVTVRKRENFCVCIKNGVIFGDLLELKEAFTLKHNQYCYINIPSVCGYLFKKKVQCWVGCLFLSMLKVECTRNKNLESKLNFGNLRVWDEIMSFRENVLMGTKLIDY